MKRIKKMKIRIIALVMTVCMVLVMTQAAAVMAGPADDPDMITDGYTVADGQDATQQPAGETADESASSDIEDPNSSD